MMARRIYKPTQHPDPHWNPDPYFCHKQKRRLTAAEWADRMEQEAQDLRKLIDAGGGSILTEQRAKRLTERAAQIRKEGKL